MRAYVLNHDLQILPGGVAGELCISGVGLARAYHNRAALTAERFSPDPYSGAPGGRIYRTGDLAHYLPDGQIEFLGRLDQQVKISGFRIEVGEIEATLRQHPRVCEAVVLAKGNDSAQKHLVAYIVTRDHSAGVVKELRAYLRKRLPDYMVPASFMLLDEMPLTPNGKVDRAGLPEPIEAGIEGAPVPLRTPVEELLAGIWGQVLNLEQINADDNFFKLGGHSLLAAQVISRARAYFQVELPLQALFETPTIAGLAEQIEAGLRAGERKGKPAPAPVSRDGWLPLSHAQQRLWFLDRLAPGNSAYNIPAATRLKGPLHLAELRRSINEIVRRHEALRTTFVAEKGRPLQIIAPSLDLEQPLIDLSLLPQDEREQEVTRLLTDGARTRFDLSTGPLLRMRIIRLEEEEHALLLIMHHIISDGWSIGILLREMGALYKAYIEGSESPLSDPVIQYADFAHWQRQMLEGGRLDEELTYWKQRLSPSPQMLELPTDRPRPAVQTNNGAVKSFALSGTLKDELKTFSLDEGVTLFMTLLAAFKVLLHRYTGQTDITVGTPIAGRTNIESECLIGFFANTLVLRDDLAGNPSFRELLRRVRETTLGAYFNQDLPYERLVEELRIARDLRYTPLFQVMMAMQNSSVGALQLPGLSATPVDTPTGTAKFDLLLLCEETDASLNFALEYNVDLFDSSTILRFIRHWQELLGSLTTNADTRISDLPLMDEVERREALQTWNDTGGAYPGPHLIHEMFERQVEKAPHAVAIQLAQQHLTYGQLNTLSNQLARHLQSLGVGPEVFVAICMERSLEMIVAIIGVLKAGGAYVPLDPAYPPQRLSFIIEDTQAPVLLTQEDLRDRPSSHQAQIVLVDKHQELVAEHHAGNILGTALPCNLAYIIYTSGSTGRPKGVAIEHHSAVTFLNWARETFSAQQLDGVLAATSICFDLSVFELFTPLVSGGRVVLVEDALHLAALAAGADVKLINTVPSLITELLRLGAIPASVQTVNLAGEALPQSLVDRIFAQAESVEQVWNLYGPSEDTTYSTGAMIKRGMRTDVSIGRPIAGTQAYLLGENMQPVVIGAAGELYLAGEGLARGYLSRPERTAELFRPNPFSAKRGTRLYRTGDLARWKAGGSIEFLGRVDHQVKLRGFRIELGEIEAVLNRHEGIETAVVVARDDVGGGKRLVAYSVARNGGPPTQDELRIYLREKLPDYMIPSAFVTLAELPLTPNGKLDRRALPLPDETRRDVTSAFVAARTATEESLTKIWSELLGLKQVGVYDNFFELGGHSLLATQVAARVAENFGIELPLRTFFEASTVAELASAVETARGRGSVLKDYAIPRVSRDQFRAQVVSTHKIEMPEILREEGNRGPSMKWKEGKS